MAIVTTNFTLLAQNSSLDTTLDGVVGKLNSSLFAFKKAVSTPAGGSGSPMAMAAEMGDLEVTVNKGAVTEATFTKYPSNSDTGLDDSLILTMQGKLKMDGNNFLNGDLSQVVFTDVAKSAELLLEGKMRFNGKDLGSVAGGLVTTMPDAYITHARITDLASGKKIDLFGNFGSDGVVSLTGKVTAIVYSDGVKAYVKDGLDLDLSNANAAINQGRVLDLIAGIAAVVEKEVWHGDIGHNLNDVFEGTYADEYLCGGLGSDKLMSGGGYDILDGGSGNDRLIGGDDGNDLRGGDGNDKLIGGWGDDQLNGGAGVDTLAGGDGNDTYIIEGNGAEKPDKIMEKSDEGNDTVISKISFELPKNVENLILQSGAGAIDGTGNKADNVITGNLTANVLNGKDGFDILTGGAGNDVFVFDTRIKPVMVDGDFAQTNIDTITDFAVGDSIWLSKKIFSAYTAIDVDLSGDFVSGPDATAQDASDHFVYDANDGALYYDPDGSGAKEAIQFAILENQFALKATDLHIV